MTDPLYRDYILDHARRPRNKGQLDNASFAAREANTRCGDVCIFTVQGSTRIERVMFDGHGCALSIAAASLLTEEVEGKNVAEILTFTDEQFLFTLGVEVTSGRLDCALLPLRTLKKACSV